jgi:hypothetical protein
VALVFACTATSLAAQDPSSAPQDPVPTAAVSLPDAPGFSSSTAGDAADASDSDSATSHHHIRLASLRDITIQPGQTAPALSAHNKIDLGLRESFTLFSMIGWTASAGYSQLLNGSPNYGTDSGAFGQRLGATSIRLISQNIIGNAFFAPIFHDDPRYYRMGPGESFMKRTLYAATRPLITRSDDGRSRLNYSLISGHIAGAALTNAYYPNINRGFVETTKTFGNSMGGSAVGFLVTEFLDDVLRFAHLQKLE